MPLSELKFAYARILLFYLDGTVRVHIVILRGYTEILLADLRTDTRLTPSMMNGFPTSIGSF